MSANSLLMAVLVLANCYFAIAMWRLRVQLQVAHDRATRKVAAVTNSAEWEMQCMTRAALEAMTSAAMAEHRCLKVQGDAPAAPTASGQRAARE
jgi:hypothetical protein